jgi:hypothetical protein
MDSPIWPNAAPRGPIRFIRRDAPVRLHEGLNIYHVDGTSHVIHVIDGEPLESILNRVYALGKLDAQKSIEDLAVELAADGRYSPLRIRDLESHALKDLATKASNARF